VGLIYLKKGIKVISITLIFIIIIMSTAVYAGTEKGEKDMTVSAGKIVSIEYTLKLKDNSVVDTNVGSKPLTYIHGSHQIIPGLEKGLEGMKVGESKHITVSPAEGYGEINEKAIIEVRKEQIPKDALKVGARLEGRNPSGQIIFVTVKEIKEDTVLLDHNHPLAGKTLYFDVKVLDIQ
jgi:FKBP-type peptidyl-prolyl cis-trans isomerase SlyD